MKDGGSAFACASENGYQSGMTLRDYFASVALNGFTSNLQFSLSAETAEMYANEAYMVADAMLKAREEK